jgi:hypothetical protein
MKREGEWAAPDVNEGVKERMDWHILFPLGLRCDETSRDYLLILWAPLDPFAPLSFTPSYLSLLHVTSAQQANAVAQGCSTSPHSPDERR